MLVRELIDGCDIEQALLVRAAEVRAKRDGGEFLRVQFGDRTGGVVAMVWDPTPADRALLAAGNVIYVRARYSVHPRFGPQLALGGWREAAPHEYAADDLHDGPPRAAAQMEGDLRELLATIQNPHLAALLDGVFGPETVTWALYRDAPAAKYYHQAYRHGLLEHSLTVAQGVSAMAATFPGIDRDVAVTGALLHDIGKLEAYTADPNAIDMTDAGRLQGEIPLGYYRVRRLIEDVDGFPPALAQAVLHIILSHHGTLEHGSPVVPCTREATLVHMIDNLGGRLGSFDRLEKELPPGAVWSSWDKAIGAGAYFPAAAAAPAAARADDDELAA
jgi:3'-5' exoribonuclease